MLCSGFEPKQTPALKKRDHPFLAPPFLLSGKYPALQQQWVHLYLPTASAAGIALFSGIAWRAELELTTGWASLKWIGEFHWAIPTGVLAFILWVLSVTHVQRPWAFAATLLV